MHRIFLSHTKKDKEFCDWLDTRIFARIAQIKGFRSEFETVKEPGWQTIKDEINKSDALFFLVGKELVKSQSSPTKRENLHGGDWRYTQNWIAYEIGVACQKGIDVWAICDEGVEINFPMPYINNYLVILAQDRKNAVKYIHGVVSEYISGRPFTIGKAYRWDYRIKRTKCPSCAIEFNFHRYSLPLEALVEHILPEEPPEESREIICPQCLKRASLYPEEHIHRGEHVR